MVVAAEELPGQCLEVTAATASVAGILGEASCTRAELLVLLLLRLLKSPSLLHEGVEESCKINRGRE